MKVSCVMLVVVGSLAYVQAAPVDRIKLITSASGDLCGSSDAQNCPGGFERSISGTSAATNVLPQVNDVVLVYEGTLANNKHISLVDKTLNNNNPCSNGAYAAAASDTRHSGKLTAGAANKRVTLSPTVGGKLLDAAAEYRVCYATGNGAANDNTWADAGIIVRISKIELITVYGRKFKTTGTIPHHSSLTMTYTGTVLTGRWISFVDQTLNNNNPCADGAIAAAPKDSKHSGSMAATAGTRTFVADTAALSATSVFAVCYAESGGITSSQWRDSGIRITRSKIKKVYYGVQTGRFGDGFKRATYNRNTDDVNGIATDMFPQIENAQLMYEGELPAGGKISLVDASLQAENGVGNPCGYPRWASKDANAGTPGATNNDERAYSGVVTGSASKVVTIPQGTNNLLNAGSVASPKVYAVCYAEGNGDSSDVTWADSYARFKISKVEALGHHNVLHTTTGVLPRTGATAAQKLLLGYTGSLGVGSAQIKFTLVKADTNQVTANGISIYEPCKLKSNAETAAGSTATGILTTTSTKKTFAIDTTSLDSGTITGNNLAKFEFAVCYTENAVNGYRDSGIRLTVGKVEYIDHGRATSGPHGPRIMRPVEDSTANLPTNWVSGWATANAAVYTGVSPGLASARNVIPRAVDQKITYFVDAGEAAKMNNRYVSLVDASRNGNKPCAIGSEAAHVADSVHTGAILATTREVTIPQNPLLDITKVYAVCYAITSGTTADTTWADSYVRVTISAVQSITSIGVTHSVSKYDGQIASRAAMVTNVPASVSQDTSTRNRVTGVNVPHANKLDLTYAGDLAAGGSLSLVDETTNNLFPCGTVYDMGKQTAGGGPTNSPGTAFTGDVVASGKTVLMATQSLAYSSKTYAACYLHGGQWFDTGIRLTRSPIYSMRFDSGYASQHSSYRDQTSVFLATNRLPQAKDQVLEYIDNNEANNELTADRWISLVADNLHNGDPCVYESATESSPDFLHSGPLKASDQSGGSGKKVKVLQQTAATLLDASKTFAVCYSTSGAANVGTASDNTEWKDSYVRLKISQVASLSLQMGKWTGVCTTAQAGCVAKNTLPGMPGATGNTIGGFKQTTITYGQLPQMSASDTGLEITYSGSLAASGYVSLVDAAGPSPAPTSHGIAYPNPCGSAANAAASSDSTHSGPLKGDTVGFCQVIGTSVANICDNNGDGAFTETCQVGARCKPASGTNGGCGSTGRCTGSQVVSLNSVALDKTKTYALCYTVTTTTNGQPHATAAPTLSGAGAATWADSGLRITISKIKELLTSSRHNGITARVQTSVFKPTNRIPAATNQKLTYVGELAASKFISLVATTSANWNPCVNGAAAAASGDASGAITANSNKVLTVVQSPAVLDKTKIFAVCYAEDGNSATDWWLDSGIRLGVSMIESLRVWGIDVVTTGQVPNTEAGLKFTYNGALANSKKIAFVDETLNSNFPCASTTASTNPTTPALKSQYSGVKASAGNKDVVLMDTRDLDTSKTFALCYTEGSGANNDATFGDSGIRVTVPKVWNTMADSGYQGPACSLATNKLSTSCKLDTKFRDMTSKPLATNRIPAAQNHSLTYVGTLAANKFISLVSHMENPSGPDPSSPNDDSASGYQYSGPTRYIGNPCVLPSVAAHAADDKHSGAVAASSKLLSWAGFKTVYFDTRNLDTSLTYAVCYAEGDGSASDSTWRDSYIRLKISQIEKMVVMLPHIEPGTTSGSITTTPIPIRTVGQIPNQKDSEQVQYRFDGTIPASKFMSLAHADTNQGVDTLTAWNIYDPCGTTASATVSTAGVGTGSKTMSGSKVVNNLDSTTLLTTRTYALCYAPTSVGSGWVDSGIRITVPEVIKLTYKGTNPAITERSRVQTSIFLATNKIPQASSNVFTYDGDLAASKYLSIVEASSAALGANQWNPCVNPAYAVTAASTTHSGVMTGSGTKVITLTQNPGSNGVYLKSDGVFAVCYSSTNSGTTDVNWRDSYIRFTVSKIDTIQAYKVVHKTTGQIPNHPSLKVNYVGTLANGKHVTLVSAQRGMKAMGSKNFPAPCAAAAETSAASADQWHTNIATAANNNKVVSLNTVDLTVSYASNQVIRYWNDMGSNSKEVYYAVCYSDAATTSGAYEDSGIRVTLPEIVNTQFDSGYSAIQTTCVKIDIASRTSHCQVSFTGAFDGQCALGSPCNQNTAGAGPNGGCGTNGVCGYQEICTSVGGTGIQNNCDTDYDGVFDQTCTVNAHCIATMSDLHGGCGSQGVCARQGTPVREQTSWDQTDGMNLIETPTNRLPQVASEKLTLVRHPSVRTTTDFKAYKVTIVKSDTNSDNPCAVPSDASVGKTAAGTTTKSAVFSASTTSLATQLGAGWEKLEITVSQATLLNIAATYAVCYAKGDGDSDDVTWRDSYVRLRMTQIQSLTTVGVVHKTTGQVPNVVTTDKLRFTYTGSLGNAKFISMVDATLNSGLPCSLPSEAGSAPSATVPVAVASIPSWSKKGTHSGVHQAKTGTKYVETFDTTYMDTSKTFALCYASGDGSSTDTWTDSGIRLTLPKIYNVQYSAQAGGPNPSDTASTVDGVCRPTVSCTEKEDTKPREQTSNPLPTNRFPQIAGAQSLTYRGALAAGKYVSLVATMTDGGTATGGTNPCVLPFYAGGPVGTRASGGQQATGNTVSIAQSNGLFDKSVSFAVCYSEVNGGVGDHTWRDSYIRLKISQVQKLIVKVPTVTLTTLTGATTTTNINILTVGQIPHQANAQQVQYETTGSLPANSKISLVHADLPASKLSDATTTAVTGFTGIYNYHPCRSATYADPGAASSTATRGLTAVGATVSSLDSTSLDTSKVFALCYAPQGTTDWEDSGVRITVSKLDMLTYIGLNDAITARTRQMTSIYLATNKLPQVASTPGTGQRLGELTYSGDLAASKHVSLVDSALNSNNPCVSPSDAAAGADTLHSGVRSADAQKKLDIPQAVKLDANKLFAICYAEGTGNAADTTWRDSYIRISISKVSLVSAHLVTHKTTGQIPSHPSLALSTHGSFAGISGSGGGLVLVDASLAPVTLGSKTYPFPCATRAVAYDAANDAAAKLKSAKAEVASAGTSIVIRTSNLDSSSLTSAEGAATTGSSTPAAGDPRYYAVCYTDGVAATATTPWTDTGIRVTVPEFINMQMSSGYGTDRRTNLAKTVHTTANDGSPWRDMTSEPLAINRLPQAAGQELNYVVSASSNGCKLTNGNADSSCGLSDRKYISLVSADTNNNDPCVLISNAEAAAGASNTGVLTAAASSKTVTIDASSLDATKTFAVCYSKGNKLWSGTAADWDDADTSAGGTTAQPYWRDTYIRLKISKLETLTALEVAHRTYGQVPNTISSDKLDFVYSGSLAAEAYLSLVMASLNNEDPCVASEAGKPHDTQHSGAAQAGKKKCVKVGATPSNNCDVDGNGSYGETCRLNALCTNDAGCGTGGQCRATVSSFTTHGLTTSPAASKMYRGVATAVAEETETGGWFAVCYKETSNAAWVDSGIRLTVSKIYTVRLSSQHTGTPDRDHTSLQLATNRFPQTDNTLLKYYGDLAHSKWVSLHKVTTAAPNPCVKGQTAATTAGADTSGVMQANNQKVFDLDPQNGANAEMKEIDSNVPVTYTLCYDETSGQASSHTWVDSYIRIQLTEVTYFETKNVRHRTTGQIPHHKANCNAGSPTCGSIYFYDGTLADAKKISLVDASLNPTSVIGFSQEFAHPCHYSTAATAAGTQHSGAHAAVAGSKRLNTLDTTNLDTTKTYALCYAGGDGTAAVAGGWQDSGIRLTVSALDTIYFSGYKKSEAVTRGKAERDITSVLPPLQLTGSLYSNVLPVGSGLTFRYGGDLTHSRWISLVEVNDGVYSATTPARSSPTGGVSSNPCVNPQTAGQSFSSTAASGPVKSCESFEGHCEFNGHNDGSTNMKNKEVTIPGNMEPDDDKVFTICYADVPNLIYPSSAATSTLKADPYTTTGRTVTGSPTWRDSYIRVFFSPISSIVTTGVTHTDHGHIANHEAASKLIVELNGILSSGWVSLVDETQASGLNHAHTGTELQGVASANEPCQSAVIAAGATTSTSASSRSGAFRIGALTLHLLSGNTVCGHDFSGANELTAGEKQNTYYLGEPVQNWACGSGIAKASAPSHWHYPNFGTMKVWTNPTGFPAGKYLVEEPQPKTVSITTNGLSTAKTFAVCYSKSNTHTNVAVANSAVVWRDSGIRVVMSKLHTIRDNRAQLPLLDLSNPAVGVGATSRFARDMSSSRAKVGRTICLVAGTGPAPSSNQCDVDGDGVYDEQCAVGTFCDPDTVNNGGCGGGKGLCNSGLGSRELTATLTGRPAEWTRTVYNHDAMATISGAESTAMHGTTLHKLRRGADLLLEYFGPLTATGRKLIITDARGNNGDPCAEPALSSPTAGATNTGLVSVSGTKTVQFSAAKLAALAATTAGGQLIPYALCYTQAGGPEQEVPASSLVDSFLRFSISEVKDISSHEIVHRTQGHIANAQRLGLTYSGTLAAGSYLSLVDETFNNYKPCNSGVDAAKAASAVSSGPKKPATSSSRQVEFDTTALSTEKNFAVCYSTDGTTSGTWHDSGIRLTVSRIAQLQYNKKTNPWHQHGTVDYSRSMGSTNLSPASDTNPIATNRIPVTTAATTLDLEYNANVGGNSIANNQFVSIVKVSLNTDKNPCTSPCSASSKCDWDSAVGANKPAKDSGRSGVLQAGAANTVVRVNQATTALSASELYAVCYAQIQSVQGQALTAVDQLTFRDSYIRLKPSKIFSFQAYGIDHYTFGDIPSKAVLTVIPTGSMSSSTIVSLVDATSNTHQPCTGSFAGLQAAALTTAQKKTMSGQSAHVGKCVGTVGGTATAKCDVDNDGVFGETCTAGKYCMVTDSGCGGATCTPQKYKQLRTQDLDADKEFAVCYTEGAGGTGDAGWRDAGIRVKTPQVQSITYGAPARVITADSCFGKHILDQADADSIEGFADCKVPLATRSDAHYQIGAMLPRAEDVVITYGGPLNAGSGLAADKWISLVEHTTVEGAQFQKYNPCRNAASAAMLPGTETTSTGTVFQDNEGGMRLHSGPLQATGSSKTVTIPQEYDAGSGKFNMLDYTKTFVVCYSSGTGNTADAKWRDSYIRITLSKIKTLSMIHTGYPASRVNVNTIGTFTNVPSLEVEWSGSLMVNRYLRFTKESKNNGAPCDKSQHALTLASDTTQKIASLAASRRVTFDTSQLANPNQETGYFAVCYATGNGGATDTTWHDSGIRLRFVRWSNPAKHRVVTGAPVRLTFALSTGRFDVNNDKVAFLKGQTDCQTAPAAPAISNGNAVKRTMDYTCTVVDTATASSTLCDSNFDGVFSEPCTLGARCDTANAATNHGCGTNGRCSGTVQLPTGKSYAEVQDTAHSNEVALAEGNYAICVCLGSSSTGTGHAATATSYGPANGNGGCNDANEFTLLFSSMAVCTSFGGTGTASTCDTNHDGTYNNACQKNARCKPGLGTNGGCGSAGVCDTGVTLKVITEPQLGRFADANGQRTLRHTSGMSQKYNIRTSSLTAGYRVENGDKIFFVSKSLGCGTLTKFSGKGTHVYDHASHSYISTGVDRRWRATVKHICLTVAGANIGNNCDANFDGVFGETCVVGALCDIANGNAEGKQGSCGATGVCGSPVPTADNAAFTAPIPLVEYSSTTGAAAFSTPSGTSLSSAVAKDMSACFATQESLAGLPHDATDYVELTHGLEVIPAPKMGPIGVPTLDPARTRLFAIENSSPSFTVNSMKEDDLIYFVPQKQALTQPAVGDCTPTVCTTVGGSNVGNNCDSDHDGSLDDKCVFMARCNPANNYHGGCGTAGKCENVVPSVSTTTYTGRLAGSQFSTAGGHNTGQLTLPSSPKLAVPAHNWYPTAWYLVACYIPAGAIKDLYTNVKQLDDVLTIIKEPTDALITSWFQYQVHELTFTRPQQGRWQDVELNPPDYKNLAAGLPGDIVVLQKSNCNNVHQIAPSNFVFNQGHTAKFVLEEAGGTLQGDEKGGAARENALATGKVNELGTGIYKICYATGTSGGESQEDFKELTKTIEILPTPETRPTLSAPRSVILGQDIVVSWASNIGLQEVQSETSSWLGLYRRGSCPTTHDCWIAYQFITANEFTGTVIFSSADYKFSGEYEVRYFKGDTRNGQGIVCRGQPGVPSETYVNCALEVATTSELITVAGQDIDETENLALRPGLEAVFGNGNRGRYHRVKLT